MGLNSKAKLVQVAKIVCRELRKNSTAAEKKLWEEVRNKKFLGKKFYRQYLIFHDLTGRETFFVVDFFCYEEKLIIELDGKYHQYKLKEDQERTKILNILELKVLRFRNEDIIHSIESVLLKIKRNFIFSAE